MIQQLLEAHLDALTVIGMDVSPVRPGRSAATVRAKLKEAGYGDRDEIVEFFTWADFTLPNPRPAMFWELPVYLDIDEAISLGAMNRETTIEPGVDLIDSHPGPPHWLPLLMLDGSEYIAIDTSPGPDGGSVWFCFTEVPNFKLFDTLAEAIEAATYCVALGAWTLDAERNTIDADRRQMPNEADLIHPPWNR